MLVAESSSSAAATSSSHVGPADCAPRVSPTVPLPALLACILWRDCNDVLVVVVVVSPPPELPLLLLLDNLTGECVCCCWRPTKAVEKALWSTNCPGRDLCRNGSSEHVDASPRCTEAPAAEPYQEIDKPTSKKANGYSITSRIERGGGGAGGESRPLNSGVQHIHNAPVDAPVDTCTGQGMASPFQPSAFCPQCLASTRPPRTRGGGPIQTPEAPGTSCAASTGTKTTSSLCEDGARRHPGGTQTL